MTPKQAADATHYVLAIRNAAKRDYARAYFAWLFSGEQGGRPNYDGLTLSAMAAQAVRMNLREIADEASK